MADSKNFKPEASVKARLHQFESAVASAEHFSKHPDQARKRLAKGSASSSDDSNDDENQNSDFVEFVQALTSDSTSGVSEKDALREAFKILDCDEDGFITLSDLREAMGGFDSDEKEDNEMTDEDLIDMIAAADEKCNGRINFDSFVRILMPSGKRHNKQNTQSRDSKTQSKFPSGKADEKGPTAPPAEKLPP